MVILTGKAFRTIDQQIYSFRFIFVFRRKMVVFFVSVSAEKETDFSITVIFPQNTENSFSVRLYI